MNQCFVKRGKTIKGPLSFKKIQQLLADKKLSKSDLAGPSNIGPWQKLATILPQHGAGESFSESAFDEAEAFNFNGGEASEEPGYTQFRPKLPPRIKKKKENSIQNPESPQPVMSEAKYHEAKWATIAINVCIVVLQHLMLLIVTVSPILYTIVMWSKYQGSGFVLSAGAFFGVAWLWAGYHANFVDQFSFYRPISYLFPPWFWAFCYKIEEALSETVVPLLFWLLVWGISFVCLPFVAIQWALRGFLPEFFDLGLVSSDTYQQISIFPMFVTTALLVDVVYFCGAIFGNILGSIDLSSVVIVRPFDINGDGAPDFYVAGRGGGPTRKAGEAGEEVQCGGGFPFLVFLGMPYCFYVWFF